MFDDIRYNLGKIRNAVIESHKKEPKNGEGAHPYSKQDEMFNSITQATKSAFGADFSNFKTPMFYYPDGDVSLSGEIPGLNFVKFQYRYLNSDEAGCVIWVPDGLTLTPENVTKLSRIYGVYKNWKQELDQIEDKRPMDMRNE